MVLDRQGRTAEAIQQYRAALEVEKDFDGALNNLAGFFAANPNNDVRNGLEAVQLAERACQLNARPHHYLHRHPGCGVCRGRSF